MSDIHTGMMLGEITMQASTSGEFALTKYAVRGASKRPAAIRKTLTPAETGTNLSTTERMILA